MKSQLKYHNVVFNHNILLNPCIGCIKRGNCEDEKYADLGAYCRSKRTKVTVNTNELRSR